MLLCLALSTGCAAPSGDFCAVARPMYIGADNVVEWLATHDEALLRGIVSHNEKTAACP